MRCSSVQNMPAHSHCGWRRHTPAGWRLRHRNVSSTTTSRGRAQRCNSAFYRRQDSAQLDQMLDRLRSGAPDVVPQQLRSVYLVGTGPGDPGLLTLHAVQLMQNADVILYDRLVSEEILRMGGPSARMVYVGKEKGYHSRTQEEIHELLLQFAEAGALTVRLKGGDPFVFGRGAEESQYLEQRGVCVRIVPGITAAAGISALLGVPLTHRGVATSVRFVTGHAREGGTDALDETIAAAADPNTTLVVYMGLSTLPTLISLLVTGGLNPDTPAVAVERGTAVDSRICHGTAAQLAELTKQAELKSPTLIVIGDVVALSPGWRMWEHSSRPLLMPGPPPMSIDLSPYHNQGAAASQGARA